MRRFSEGDYRILLHIRQEGGVWVGGEGITHCAANRLLEWGLVQYRRPSELLLTSKGTELLLSARKAAIEHMRSML